MSTFFSASGNSPTPFDPNPNPKVLPSKYRHQTLLPLVEAITNVVQVGLKTSDPESAFPRVSCRECSAEGWISILRSDSFERLVHEPNCGFGKALRKAVRIATFPEPTEQQISASISSLENKRLGFLYQIAQEQGLEVEGGAR